MLKLEITRVSHTHHRLSYTRDDGSHESTELESKTFLMHDFIHFCLEKEAGLSDGFFGLLIRGCTYADLSYKNTTNSKCKVSEDIERITGILTGVIKNNLSGEDAIASAKNMYAAYETSIPDWLDAGMIMRASDRYKKLMGAWNSLSFGETLTLEF